MAHIYIFYAVQIAACLYALRVGGSPEKAVAILLLVAAVSTTLNDQLRSPSFGGVDSFRVGIDAVLFVGLVGVAALANRFWPLYISALHLIEITVHGVRAYQPELVPWIYSVAVGKIAYPMLLVLIIGTARHRRREADYGTDPDWSGGLGA